MYRQACFSLLLMFPGRALFFYSHLAITSWLTKMMMMISFFCFFFYKKNLLVLSTLGFLKAFKSKGHFLVVMVFPWQSRHEFFQEWKNGQHRKSTFQNMIVNFKTRPLYSMVIISLCSHMSCLRYRTSGFLKTQLLILEEVVSQDLFWLHD